MTILKYLIATIGNFPKANIKSVLEKMLESANFMGARIMDSGCLENPDVAYIILGESHMFLHVFEGDQRSAFLDVMTCGEKADPEKGYKHLKKQIGFSEDNYKTLSREI